MNVRRQTNFILFYETMFQNIVYRWLKSTTKEWEVIDIAIPGYDNPIGESKFLIKARRKAVDEQSIENGVKILYSDRLNNLIDDPDNIRREMKKELDDRIYKAWEEWQKLPKAMIFEVFIRKVERKSGHTYLLCSVSLPVARYFIENKEKIHRMEFDFEKIPYFTFDTDMAWFIRERVNLFNDDYTVKSGPENKTQSPQINKEDWAIYDKIELADPEKTEGRVKPIRKVTPTKKKK